MASQASSQPETTVPRLQADLHEGSVIIPNQGHGLRSNAVCCSVRARSIARSFSEVMAPLPGSLSFRTGWDSPWNPVYSIFKVQLSKDG